VAEREPPADNTILHLVSSINPTEAVMEVSVDISKAMSDIFVILSLPSLQLPAYTDIVFL
jgi:hypothetical protein